MRIKKIKDDGKKIRIEYELPVKDRTDEWDEYSLNCSQSPRPQLRAALDALTPHLLEICELPSSYRDGLEIRGVSFSHTDGVMGATITGLKTLKASNAPLVLNTPHKPEAPYGEGGDESNLLEPACAEALWRVAEEAKLYVNGERLQPELQGTETSGDGTMVTLEYGWIDFLIGALSERQINIFDKDAT